jgi:hypothetical protein
MILEAQVAANEPNSHYAYVPAILPGGIIDSITGISLILCVGA